MNGDRILGTVHYYLNPHASSDSNPTVAWVKLGTGGETPTFWYDVDVNLTTKPPGISTGNHLQSIESASRPTYSAHTRTRP
jgi:hypothetical protein